MEVLKNNNIKLQGVYLPGTKSYTSVPLLYLESYYQELEDGKKLEDVWQKIAQDYQKCQEAEISIDGISSREWDYETIKKSLTVYVRNAQENIDFLTPIIRSQLKSVVDIQADRIAGLVAKTCIQAGAAAYLSAEALNSFVPEKERKSFVEAYDAARKKAVSYIRASDTTENSKKQDI